MNSNFSKYATVILLIGSLTLVLARNQEQECREPDCSGHIRKNVEKAPRQFGQCGCAEEILDDEESIEKPAESDESVTEDGTVIQSPVDESADQADGVIDEELPIELAVENNKNVKYEIFDQEKKEGIEEPSRVDLEAKQVVEKSGVKASKPQENYQANSKSKRLSDKKTNNKRAKRDTKSKNAVSIKGSSKQAKGKKFSKKSGKKDSSRKSNQKKGSKKN